MKYSELSSKNRAGPQWLKFAAAGLLAVAIAGCGGGSDGAAGPTGPAGADGAQGAPGVNLTALVNVGSNTTAATPAAVAAWASLAPQVTVTGVTIASPPVVSFIVKDAAGKAVVGLGNYSQSSSATVKGLTNLSFTLAKLVPGTNGDPSKWVSYNVIRPVTVAEQGGTIGANAACNKTATAAATWCGTYPTTDTQGTLVDNGDGSYKYTFLRDPKQVATIVAGLTDSTDGLSKKADLGDLSFDATLTHRVGVALTGNAPGTGNNTPTAATTTPGVALANPANAVFDFRPDGGTVATTRDIVKIETCASCHDSKPLAHGNSRKDPKFCVTCHTEQVKFSFDQEAPMLADGITFAVQTGSNAVVRPAQAVLNGRAVGNFPNYIHKLHMGGLLNKQGYNYNNDGGAMNFNNVVYPQNVANCTKCHDGSTNAVSTTPVTANGDNWKSVPNLLACGSCHDGINFATGQGTTVAGANTGHIGGAKANNAQCVLCHDATTIPVYHAADNASPHNPTVPVGLKNFKYEIKSAAATATSVTVVFKITADGTPVTFVAPATPMANPLVGFTGAPSFLLAYAKTQDGVAVPVDYNNLGNGVANAQPVSVSIANLLDTAKATSSGTLAGPDASGYYTATIVGTANVFPAGAVLRTVALQGYFTQVAPAAARHTLSVVKMVGSDAARRSVVEPNKCGNCHEVFEGHGGNRNIGLGSEGIVVCLVCHNPGLVTSGRGIPDTTLANWKFTTAEDAILTAWGVVKTAVNGALGFPQVSNDFKDMIHGIHAGKDRTNPIAIARNRGASVNLIAGTQSGAITLIDGAEISFPGILNNCESCHKAGTYSNVPANTLVSTHEADNGVFLNGVSRTPADAAAALKQPNALDKVTTPFTAACVSCHDTSTAKAHMTLNGGQILVLRTAANTAGESCAVCHSAGKDFDAAVVHK